MKKFRTSRWLSLIGSPGIGAICVFRPKSSTKTKNRQTCSELATFAKFIVEPVAGDYFARSILATTFSSTSRASSKPFADNCPSVTFLP